MPTTGGAARPGVNTSCSASHRCALRYTARVPLPSTITALLSRSPPGPASQKPPTMVSPRPAASRCHSVTVGPSAGSASDRASAGDSNTYPDGVSSGSTTTAAPASAAACTASLAAARLAVTSPTARLSWQAATRIAAAPPGPVMAPA